MAAKKKEYIYTVGRRKTSSARVRLYESIEKVGEVEVNGVPYTEYFPEVAAEKVIEPFARIDAVVPGFFTVKVTGGGIHSQAEAVRHGISRALVAFNEDWKEKLKPAGLMTRDPRMKERKKAGLKRARRAPQWSKR